MSEFFICYSRKVQDEVVMLSQELDLLGHSGWFDQKLAGGQAWWDEILAKIRACDFFIVALAPDTLNSTAANREWNYASNLHKTILPVLLADGVSDRLLPPVLTRIQYVDYRKADRRAAFALVNAINNLPPSGAPPDKLPESPEVPISYLSGIKDRIESPTNLTYDEQTALVLRLQEGVQNQDDIADIRVILDRFRQRDDLLAKTDRRLDELHAKIEAEGGRPKKKVVIRDPMLCFNCGNSVPDDARFCVSCGASLSNAEDHDGTKNVSPPVPPIPPETDPQPPPSPVSFIRPPDLHWFLVLFITMTTFGFFGVVWSFVQAAWAKKVDPTCNATAMFAVYTVGLVPYLVTLFSKNAGVIVLGFFWYIACLVFYIVGMFSIRRAIHRYYADSPLSLHLSGGLVFFFNIYYLQYQFNRITEWHKTGVLPAKSGADSN